VSVPEFDESTTSITFHKSDCAQPVLQEDCCYIISVEDYILNPPDGFTLHTNWNNNKMPKHKVMKIDVSKIMGKMVKVHSIGYSLKDHQDILDMWEGWLPEKAITVIERL
jgi:hypothetical protein